MLPGRMRWLGLAAVLATAIVATHTYRPSTDSNLNHLQTLALVQHGDIDLARYDREIGFTVERGSSRYSIYGAGISMLAAPVYAPLSRTDLEESDLHAAVTIPFALGAILLMLVLLRRVVSGWAAGFGTAVFAFGTTFWPTATTAFWQHAPVSLLQITGLLALQAGPRWFPAAGLAIGTSVWVRPPVAIPALVITLYVATKGWRALARFLAGAALPAVAYLVENMWVWDSAVFGGRTGDTVGFDGSFAEGILGQTLGWRRGLFVYSPVLLVAVAAATLVLANWRREPDRFLGSLAVAAAATILTYAFWEQWYGGDGQYGYRLLLDAMPMMITLLAVGADRLRRWRPTMVALAAVSVANMAVGTLPDRWGWDEAMSTGLRDGPLGSAWAAAADQPAAAIGRIMIAALGIAAIAWFIRGDREAPS